MMDVPISAQCRSCIASLKTIISKLSSPNQQESQANEYRRKINNELERFSLWIGSVEAMHSQASSMALEWRLRDASEILIYVRQLLSDLTEVIEECRSASLVVHIT
jgi:hypothetical protein